MARDGKSNGHGASSPDRRYQQFEQDNAAWDRRVKDRLSRVDKATRELKQVTEREKTATGG